jgi:hypothetical protein
VILGPDSPPAEPRKYIGHCIYCGVTGGGAELGDEHVAPAGLMGTFILERASCKKHERITSFFEGKALRGVFGAVRELERIGSGRRKERPPQHITYENSDGTVERIEIDLFKLPYILAMPVLPTPGLLAGRGRSAGFPPNIEARTHTNDAARRRMQELEAADPLGRKLIWHFDFGNFTKLIAKVSYCYAVFFMGEVFKPLILDLILADKDDVSLGPYFVGAAFSQPGAQYPPLPTRRKFSTMVRVERIGSTNYVIARSQFFNDRGMPIYDAVVGTVEQEVFEKYAGK